MKRFLDERRVLRGEYPLKERLDALAGAFLLAFLLFVPVFGALGELVVVLMHRRVGIFLGITAAACLATALTVRLYFQSLGLKKPSHQADFKLLFWGVSGIAASAVLVLGVAFTFILLPILWV